MIQKLMSARFWMALILTLGFVWGFREKLIGGEAFTAVVLIVVRDYFNKQRQGEQK